MISKISIVTLFIILAPILYSQEDLKIISSDRNSIVIEYTPDFSDSVSFNIDNQSFLKLSVKGGHYADILPGVPVIPLRSINLGVPAETGNTIQILNAESTTVEGRLIPSPDFNRINNHNEEVYKLTEKYNTDTEYDLVSFGEFGLLRGLPVQTIIIAPVKFNSYVSQITYYTRITFRIDFSGEKTYSQFPADNFIADAVLNFNEAKYWVKSSRAGKITQSSVLAEGKWIKFLAPEEGFYKIDRQTFASFGLDPNVDPRTIKIYNNGGKMLPEKVSQPTGIDLTENAILIFGEEDGRFDENDFILFYGRGINFWDYDSVSNKIIRHFHLYSNENYYLITAGGAPGKRITGKENSQEPAEHIMTTTPGFTSFEEEKINITRSGRYFFGDDFTESLKSRTYMNKLDGLIAGSEINYNFQFINTDKPGRQLTIEENGTNIYSSLLRGTGSVNYTSYQTGIATYASMTYSNVLPEDRSLLRFTFNASGIAKGYLDYFEIRYLRNLSAYSDQLLFFSPDTTGITEYHLNNFSNSNIRVFDISDHSNVKLITGASISGGDYFFRASEQKGNVSKYFAVGNNNFKIPVSPAEVPNSDVHGITTGAQFIIITHNNFRQEAERLKQHKESNSMLPISTVIIDIEHIYNEFSGGLRDVTGIRNFIKYAYETWQTKPEYVLLFGDGDYDFKNIEGYNRNFIPSFQHSYTPNYSDNNFSHVYSYNTDDYFVRISGDDLKIDLAIGRITVATPSEAKNAVDKIIYYERNSEKGIWRNRISLVADDGYTSSGWEGDGHTRASETLAIDHIPESFDLNKIYLAAFPAELTSAGKRKPGVTQEIVKSINEGSLIVNYTGHGSPEVWAHEVVFEKSQTIPKLINDNYFFLTAATCDFSYFDNPAAQSGGEELLLKPSSGAIAVYSATRAVFQAQNNNLMYNIFHDLLKTDRDTLNLPISLGRAVFLTKQKLTGVNDQKFHLLGDPTVRLHIPHYNAAIDSINGVPSAITAHVKALGRTNITGEVKKHDGTRWAEYNGEGLLTVYDSERIVRLPELNNLAVTYQGGVIFKGRVSITNGVFKADFIVPKDISYENKNGKILFYFYDNEVDGLGFNNNIIVGGTDTTAVNDGKGPEIDIFLNNTVTGNFLVNPDALLIVKLKDETGLNTTGSGIGHMLEGILNDNDNAPIDLSQHFTGDLDAGGRSGEIRYRFNELSEGEYKIQVKAWDVFNNFSSEISYFSVTSGNDLVVRDVYNYPNPFSSSTTFTFQQNHTSPIDLKIKVYTIAGRLIKEIERYNYSGGFVTVDWDGRDNDGNAIANGTYLYKLIVNSVDGQFTRSVLGKLAVIR